MNGYNAVSGSGDHTAKLWDLSKLEHTTGTPLLDTEEGHDEPLVKTFYGHSAGITCLEFQEGTLLTGSIDKTIRRFDMETGTTVSVLYASAPLNDRVDSLLYPTTATTTSFFEQGSHIQLASPSSAVSSDYSFSQLLSNPDFAGWDESATHSIPTQSRTCTPHHQSAYVGGLHFWQHAVAAGYSDGIIRLYDLRSGVCHRSLVGHLQAVTTVTFDDYEIISGSHDKTIKVSLITCKWRINQLGVGFKNGSKCTFYIDSRTHYRSFL